MTSTRWRVHLKTSLILGSRGMFMTVNKCNVSTFKFWSAVNHTALRSVSRCLAVVFVLPEFWVWHSNEKWILKYYLLSLRVIQSHFSRLHVNKYVHLFLRLQLVFSVFLFSFSVARWCLHAYNSSFCFVPHSSAYVAQGPGPPGERRCYRLNPSSKERFGDIWRVKVLLKSLCLSPYLLADVQSVIIVPALLRVVQSGHTVNSYSDTVFNPQTVLRFFKNILSTG